MKNAEIPVRFFYIFCFLSGQLVTDFSTDKYGYFEIVLSSYSLLMCFLLLLANLGSMSFNIYVVARCPWKYCSYFCAKYYNSHDLLDALVRSTYMYDFNYNNSTINATHDPQVSLLGGINPESISQYENWNKAVISAATFSAFLSYYMMVFLVLLPMYSTVFCCCFHRDNGLPSWMKPICTPGPWDLPFKRHEGILLPFCDKPCKKEKQSTDFGGSQKVFFLSYFIVNLIFFGSSLGVFINILKSKMSKSENTETEIDINESGLMFQFISQFCAIQSCFIFSKVAYGVSNKQDKLVENLKKLDLTNAEFQHIIGLDVEDWPDDNADDNEPDDNDPDEPVLQRVRNFKCYFIETKNAYKSLIFPDAANPGTEPAQEQERPRPPPANEFYTKQARLAILKKIDSDFIKNMNASLIPFSHWFTVHWFLYTLTTFMSTAFLVETYVRYLYTPHSNKWWHAGKENVLIFSYVALFCLTHAFLFIYPCFRAAMITASRNRAIKDLASYEWKHLSISVQNAFLNYLKSEDFGFKISFFCMHDITFGFNLAFVSIFIGMFGIIMKLSL